MIGSSADALGVLAIGNSFSRNATEYLPQLAASQGRGLILSHAALGGWSVQRHWEAAEKHQADPRDPQGTPYALPGPDGTPRPASLERMLRSQPWDIVTFQQHSLTAMDLDTYQPYAGQLADYVRRHAPQAKLWMHETWAYRADHPLLKRRNLTQEQMYQRLRDAYATIARQTAADWIIPVGTAFQTARHDPRWQLDVQEDVHPQAFTYPDLPRQVHALCSGWRWDMKASPPVFGFDGKHCTPAGKYLGAMIWFGSLFGDIDSHPFAPAELSPEDAAVLQDIARGPWRRSQP